MSDDQSCHLLDDGRVIELRAPVTVVSAGALHELAKEAAARGSDVWVRCTGADYLDAAALQVLLALQALLVARGNHLTLEAVSPTLSSRLVAGGFQTLLAPSR